MDCVNDMDSGTARTTKTRAVLAALVLLTLVLFLASCSNPVTPGIFYSNHIFRVVATSAYSGVLASDSSNTLVNGTGNQDITETVTSGQQYSLTLYKSANDGTALTVELIANEIVDGSAISVVIQSSTTTDPSTPARVVLID